MSLIAALAPAAISGISSLIGYGMQRSALKGAGQMSKLEREYLRNLRERRETGAYDVPALTSQVSQQQQELGRMTQQRATGGAISRGLEKSIVTSEIKRKVDADTLRRIAEESREIALRNEQSKVQAEQELGQFASGRAGRLQNIAMARAQMAGGLVSGLGTAVGQGVDAYQQGKADRPWEGMKPEQFTGMSDEMAAGFYSNLNPQQQMEFLKYLQSIGVL